MPVPMNAPPLPGFLGELAPLLDRYGYLAVAGLVLVEDFGVPAPGEAVLIAAAVYAGAGHLNVLAVGFCGFLAAVAGDNIGYGIGHYGGRALVERCGRYVLLTPTRLARAEAFVSRRGGVVVTVARFIEGLRQANGIIAGTTGMAWRRFLGYNALGAALWVGLWVSLGDLAGTHLNAIYNTATRYQRYVLLALAIAAAAVAAIRHVTHRRTPRRREGRAHR